MKKIIFSLIASILIFTTYAQNSFEKGYFIENNNQKTNCFLKNNFGQTNPIEFQYKISENEKAKKETIANVKEFGINDELKYIRFDGNIDRSSEIIGHLSKDRNPLFKKEQLFLKVLVEGKANLYSYQDGHLKRYFYKTDKETIEQLIYKSYVSYSINKQEDMFHRKEYVKKNTQYKQQLWNNLKCNAILLKEVENIDYRQDDLVKFFVKYNTCDNSQEINNYVKKDRFINFSIRPGINYSSLTMQKNGSDFTFTDFGDQLNFRLGLEIEFIIPLPNNNLAIVVEPTFRSYKADAETVYIQTSTIIKKTNVLVDYKSIELPLSIRYYSFFNQNSKLFFDATMVFDYPFPNSIYSPERKDIIDFDISSKISVMLGLGYKYDKYSLELIYNIGRKIIKGNSWDSNYKGYSLVLGYTLF